MQFREPQGHRENDPSAPVNIIGFRPDIEGLRAIAVLLVLVYHADPSLLPGGYIGVDVFFVISGFLITGLLLRELRERGSISFMSFYARRARRLLPAASVVLVAVAAMTVLFLPRIRWVGVGGDAVASSLYFINWRLADTAGDYLAQDYAPSPLQHFWSLAVEEQFYLFWPLLILAIAAIARTRRSPTMPLVFGLLAVALPSYLWSIVLTEQDQGRSYFVTTTRVWELALGALVALGAHRLTLLKRPYGATLTWAGMAAILWSAFTFSSDSRFPGWIAILPTLAVSAVIIGGIPRDPVGAVALLRLRPIQVVGRMSYSLYLWHWPLLVVAASLLDAPATPLQGFAVVAFSALPAYATYRFIEAPVRFSRADWTAPIAVLRLGALAMGITALIGLLVIVAAWPPPPPIDDDLSIQSAPTTATASANSVGSSNIQPVGAMTLADDPRGDPNGAPVDQVASFTPTAEQARVAVPPLSARGCHAERSDTEPKSCVLGQVGGPVKVALVGDSHAAQWVLPLELIAKERGWELHTYTKSACPFADVSVLNDGSPYGACSTWNRNVVDSLVESRPAIVITSTSRYVVDGFSGTASDDQMVAGYRRTWQKLRDASSEVVVIGDTPYPGIDIADCVSRNGQQLTRCAVARSKAIIVDGPLTRAALSEPKVEYVNLEDSICPTDLCAAVIGGVLVYRDTNHLTATYAKSLKTRLEAALPSVR